VEIHLRYVLLPGKIISLPFQSEVLQTKVWKNRHRFFFIILLKRKSVKRKCLMRKKKTKLNFFPKRWVKKKLNILFKKKKGIGNERWEKKIKK